MQKPLIFISHIAEEKELAQALKDLVLATFLGMVDVFVASDPTSIKAGQKWLDEITHALKLCKIEIILASPHSIRRPWINFEAGCGWIRNISVIPLCHSGMDHSKLPPPLSSLQSAVATQTSGLDFVFAALADVANGTLPKSAVDYSAFIATVKAFESVTKQIVEMERASPVPATSGLLPYEVATLVKIAETAYSPDDTVAFSTLKSSLAKEGFLGIAVSLAIKKLSRMNLLETGKEHSWNNNEEFPVVKVSEEGWEWLEGNKANLKLTDAPPPDDPPDVSLEFPQDEVPF